jgi:membrane fusion protein (multidrug efflux system)
MHNTASRSSPFEHSSAPFRSTLKSSYSRSFARASMVPAVIATFVACLALTGCGKAVDAQGPGGPGGAPQAAPVPVVEVKFQDLPLSFEYPAQVSGFKEVEIRARVAGILEKRQFEEGGRVKQGQSLYALDNAPYETALVRALADEKAAAVRVEQADRDFKRIEPLQASKAVSQAEIDNAKSALDVAKANLSVAQARVKEARLNLTYARVESPITGIASRSLKSEGSLISGPQELLTTVTQVDKVYVNFGIPEADHNRLKAGQADGSMQIQQGGLLKIEVLGSDGKPKGLESQLAFQDVRVNPATGTVDARAVLNNPKEVLSPGQFVRVRLSGAVQKNSMLLPQRAVLQGPMGAKIVMTVGADNKVAPRPVEVAQWAGDQWVVTKGLQAGDKVMTDGFMKAPPGTPVQPMLADAKAGEVKPAQAQPASPSEANPNSAKQVKE